MMTEEKTNFSTLIQFRNLLRWQRKTVAKIRYISAFLKGNVSLFSSRFVWCLVWWSREVNHFFPAVVYSDDRRDKGWRRNKKALHEAANNGTIRQEANINPLSFKPALKFSNTSQPTSTKKRPSVSFSSVKPHTMFKKLSLCFECLPWSLRKRKVCRWFEERITARWWKEGEEKASRNFFIGFSLPSSTAQPCVCWGAFMRSNVFSSCFFSIYFRLWG